MGMQFLPVIEPGDVVVLSAPGKASIKTDPLYASLGDGPWEVSRFGWFSNRGMVYLNNMEGNMVTRKPISTYYFETQPFLTQVHKSANESLAYKPGL